jgi:hypothetical protein
MSTHEPQGGAASADELLDERDRELLDMLRECYETLDPMPDGLVERSLFAIAVQDVDAEVFQLAEQYRLESSGARGGSENSGDGEGEVTGIGAGVGAGDGEEARVVTFDSDSLTIMIRISQHGDLVRIDGWLAPPQACLVELRSGERTVGADADAEGRFVLDAIPRGLAQLVVRLGGNGETLTGSRPQSILTPAIVL